MVTLGRSDLDHLPADQPTLFHRRVRFYSLLPIPAVHRLRLLAVRFSSRLGLLSCTRAERARGYRPSSQAAGRDRPSLRAAERDSPSRERPSASERADPLSSLPIHSHHSRTTLALTRCQSSWHGLRLSRARFSRKDSCAREEEFDISLMKMVKQDNGRQRSPRCSGETKTAPKAVQNEPVKSRSKIAWLAVAAYNLLRQLYLRSKV